VNTNTVTITVVAPLVSAIASDDTICAGSSTTLTANAISTGTVTVGSGSTTTSSYDGMFYSLWSNLHEQILVTAADLTAAGLAPGNITSLAINVTSAGSLPMIDFSLKIATTSATNM